MLKNGSLFRLLRLDLRDLFDREATALLGNKLLSLVFFARAASFFGENRADRRFNLWSRRGLCNFNRFFEFWFEERGEGFFDLIDTHDFLRAGEAVGELLERGEALREGFEFRIDLESWAAAERGEEVFLRLEFRREGDG